MIVGASLGSFRGLELEPAMELYMTLAKEFNLKAVEIRLDTDKEESVLTREMEKKVGEFLVNYEVSGIHLPFMHTNPVSLKPEVSIESLERLEKGIETAGRLNMKYAVMHARGLSEGMSRQSQMERWEQVIRRLSEHAERNFIVLTLENSDFLSNLKKLADMVRKINSPYLKITLDTGHAYVRRVRQTPGFFLTALMLKAADVAFSPSVSSRNMPYEDYGSIGSFVETEGDLIYNLHVHDHNGKRDHITIGSGKIDFAFISEVKELPLIIEAQFNNHYQDVRRNYQRLMGLIKGE